MRYKMRIEFRVIGLKEIEAESEEEAVDLAFGVSLPSTFIESEEIESVDVEHEWKG